MASHSRPRASGKIEELSAELEQLRLLEANLGADPSLATLQQGTPEWHMGMSMLLDARGDDRYAHGHRLRALEMSGGNAASTSVGASGLD